MRIAHVGTGQKRKLMVHHSLLATEVTYLYMTRCHILNRCLNKIFHWFVHTKVYFWSDGEEELDVDESMQIN